MLVKPSNRMKQSNEELSSASKPEMERATALTKTVCARLYAMHEQIK